MKAHVTRTPVFTPVVISITFETRAELENMKKILDPAAGAYEFFKAVKETLESL